MITVTEDAKTMLNDILTKVLSKVHSPALPAARNKLGLRLVLQEEGLALGVDMSRDGDDVYEHEGYPVLLVDQDTGLLLDGVTVDAEMSIDGRKLTITRGGEEQVA